MVVYVRLTNGILCWVFRFFLQYGGSGFSTIAFLVQLDVMKGIDSFQNSVWIERTELHNQIDLVLQRTSKDEKEIF